MKCSIHGVTYRVTLLSPPGTPAKDQITKHSCPVCEDAMRAKAARLMNEMRGRRPKPADD